MTEKTIIRHISLHCCMCNKWVDIYRKPNHEVFPKGDGEDLACMVCNILIGRIWNKKQCDLCEKNEYHCFGGDLDCNCDCDMETTLSMRCEDDYP